MRAAQPPHITRHPMSNHLPLSPADPSAHLSPEEVIGQWTPQQTQTQFGFPPEVPRHPPQENPEWSPGNPQEVPVRHPAPIPDWSPSSSAESAIIDDEEDTTKHDSPARPDDKHDQGQNPDERHGPLVVEDPSPDSQPADEGGDIEEPGSEKQAALVAGSGAAPDRFTPSGRLMRFTSEEAYY
jgi:hypothetical protein